MGYHVLPVEVASSAVSDGLTTTALNGESLSFAVNSGSISINSGSEVILTDVSASNGVIHAIDNVLLPSWVSHGIVDRAVGSSLLTTLVDLVVSAGLTDTLSGEGPFTVFAPTNDAFLEFLGEGTDAGSLDLNLVSTILTYHVLPGIYSVSDIENGLSLTTVQGEDLSFSLMGNTAMVNGESVVSADILANNGIVHVIDGVLIPIEVTVSVEMQESLSDPLKQTTLALMGSDQSSSGYKSSVTTMIVAAVVVGAAIAIVF